MAHTEVGSLTAGQLRALRRKRASMERWVASLAADPSYLELDTEAEPSLTCTKTGMVVTFTTAAEKYTIK